MNSIDIAQRYSKAGRERLVAFKQALKRLDADGIAGDVVECGVWQGGHIILARMVSRHRTCWLYDTFAGMTAPTEVDVSRKGRSALESYTSKVDEGLKWAEVSLVDVMANLVREGVFDSDLLRFVVGDVCDTLLDEANLPDQIALLRLDTDWYKSTRIELEVLFPRLVPGGVLIIDDYGHWVGAKNAADEYLTGAGYAGRLAPIDYTGAMLVK